jgi:hypothetical protein
MRQHLGNQMSTLINEMRTYVEQPTAYGRARQWFGQHGLFLQGFTQNMVDTIVWNAAFDEQLATADASWTEDEVRAHAVSYADSVVRTSQLVLRAIDVSAGEAGTPFERLLTQFMSYFNSVAQANATAWEAALRSVNWNVPRAVPHLLWAYLVGLALPAKRWCACSAGDLRRRTTTGAWSLRGSTWWSAAKCASPQARFRSASSWRRRRSTVGTT